MTCEIQLAPHDEKFLYCTETYVLSPFPVLNIVDIILNKLVPAFAKSVFSRCRSIDQQSSSMPSHVSLTLLRSYANGHYPFICR